MIRRPPRSTLFTTTTLFRSFVALLERWLAVSGCFVRPVSGCFGLDGLWPELSGPVPAWRRHRRLRCARRRSDADQREVLRGCLTENLSRDRASSAAKGDSGFCADRHGLVGGK